MSQIFKRIFLLGMFTLCCGALFAQKVTFEASAPSAVMAGEIFRVEYSVNANVDKFIPPAINSFEVMAGPTKSEGQSITVVNGNMTSSVNVSFTYVLVGQQSGVFTIPAAKIEVGGQTYTSNSIDVEVVADNNSGGGNEGSGRQQHSSAKPKSSIAADDIFVRVLINKTDVFKGQPVKAVFKLYTRVPLIGIEGVRYPAFNGFWTQEVGGDAKQGRETVNSKVYDTQIIREYLLYPQQAGKLSIEQFDMTVVAQVVTQARRQSIFDDFFSDAATVQPVRKKLVSSPVYINAKDLPAGAPESFNGAVGNFTMSADRSSASIAANSSSTFSIKISGDGNLPLIQAPKLELPGAFEQYNVKTTESLKTTGSGIVGYRQFEYPIIARAEGNYQIPAVQFSYFSPTSKKYVTLSTGDFSLEVLPDSTGGASVGGGGMVSGLTKEDIKILGQDIRFIKINSARLSKADNLILGSVWYFAILLAIIAIFVFLLVYLQKRIKEMQNSVLVKGKRANKVALQRLKAAKEYMIQDNQRKFYEEMLRALWGYMSDKLNIPVANLTKDNVREELLKKSINLDQANAFINIITECEYAQYSPGGSGQMQEIYNNAVNSISKFESSIKK